MKHKLSALLLFSLLFATCSAFAQKYTGTILGTVADSSGAMMPNVTVTARNVATAAVRTTTTNGQGEYTIQDLAAGTYELKASAPNFKEVVARNVELHVSSNATINLKLQPGGTTEVVSVEANALQVETSTGAVGNVVDGTQVRELPLNGRSFVQLTQLMPGVSPQANFDSKHKGLEAGVDFSVNGNSTTGNIFMVDGVNNNDIGSNRTILVYPSIDSIQEFKMLRNSYGPEYGQAMGAIINIVTRGGSNNFHGSAYYFGRNDALNATDWFNSLNKIPKDKLRRNDFGYNVGGPIKKDKLFFFWSQEWNRELRGKARTGDVPTAAEKNGDFSNRRTDKDNNGNPCDPAPAIGGTTFTNISQVPTGGLSNAGKTYLKMFPDPNQANPVNCQNWATSITAPIYWREENIRGDYNLGKTWMLFGRFTQDHWEQPFPGTLGFWGDDQFPSIEGGWKQPGYQATVKLTKLFGNSAVNDFQVSYAANRITVSQSGTNPGLNDQIIAASPTFYPLSQKFNGNKIGYPGFWGGCGPDCATGSNLWMQGPWHNNEQLYIAKDDLSKVWRSHTFKVGFLVSNNQKNEMVENESQENAFYWGAASNNTGNGAFNMLWNQVQWGGSENQTNPYSQIRWHDVEPYFGDTWKMRPNLTVEYGFRWSFLRMPYSGPDRIATFSPSAFNAALGNDACNGLLLPPGTNFCQAAGFKGGAAGVNRALKDNNNHAIAPRLGFAWDPWGTGKTAIRAGVGQFFQRERLNNTLQMATNPPFSLTADYGPGRFLDVAPAPGALKSAGAPGFAQDTSDILPNTWQWNLTAEHQFSHDSKMELAYVGNRGVHMLQYTDANPVPASQRLTYALNNGNSVRQFGAANFGFITDAFWGGDSNYHALQALYRAKVKSVDAQFAYTWSKSLSDTDITNSGNNNRASLLQDPANPHLNYGPSQINRPHVFTSNIVYNAPQLNDYNSFVKTTLGGWEMATILQYTSGSSLSIFNARAVDTAPGGISGAGANQDNIRPLVVPGQPCRAPSGSPEFQWLNPNRWTMVGYQIGTFGGTGAANASVGECSSPGMANTDFSLYKNFKLTERFHMQFRMEFFNLFNKAQFLGNYQDTANINTTLSNSVRGCTTTSTSATDMNSINNPASACFRRPINTVTFDAANTRNPTFGQVTKDRGPREIQYGLKFIF